MRPAPLLIPYSPPPPYTRKQYRYLFTQGKGKGDGGVEELTREKVRAAIVHKAG